jgi:hypothetical protein
MVRRSMVHSRERFPHRYIFGSKFTAIANMNLIIVRASLSRREYLVEEHRFEMPSQIQSASTFVTFSNANFIWNGHS